MNPKNFLEALFDFSFTSFITTKLVKVLYGLCIAVFALVSVFIVLGALKASIIGGFFALIIVAPIFFSMAVVYSRVMLEIIVVFFRISEQMSVVADHFRPAGSVVSPGAEIPAEAPTAPTSPTV